ncbi:stress up-regulated Nod 19 protein [Trifolium repens]|nr:stress up-regulated Nod 19 protein [Trifolium repens]
MRFVSQDWMFSSAISSAILALVLVMSVSPCSSAISENTENNVKTTVYLSPKIELSPGFISNKIYYDVEFPKGHVALKSFHAELVDESGKSVPLQQTYLHHWIVLKYQQPKNVTNNSQKGIIMERNSGMCQGEILDQYYGLGAETRDTNSYIPDPYGVEIGNPSNILEGYDEKWMINVHAIDTRGVEDRMGCIECRCDLYNVTINALTGKPLSPSYKGGLGCCPDNAQCKMRKSFLGPKNNLYLKYTIKWVNWDKFVLPVKIYILDATDHLKISYNYKSGMSIMHTCEVEYQVKPCNKSHVGGSGCVDVNRASIPIKSGGYIIYSVGHQHVGAIRSTLYGQV